MHNNERQVFNLQLPEIIIATSFRNNFIFE